MFFHVKYVYDWLKPIFASVVIIAGRVNASARKTHVGVLAPHLGDQPLPERERLRVRVVDAEDPHAVLDPVKTTSRSASQSPRQSSEPKLTL